MSHVAVWPAGRGTVCVRVMQLGAEGWPSHGTKEPALYWGEQGLLTVQDGLLLKGQRGL